MPGRVPLSSPVDTSWVTMLGKWPVWRSVSAMVPPSRMRWVASVKACSITELPATLDTVSMASMSGMPALRSTLKVRQVRARMDLRMRLPKSGILSLQVSKKRRPPWVWYNAKRRAARTRTPRMTRSNQFRMMVLI